MPIELEEKYLLVISNLEEILKHDLKKYHGTIDEIQQAYVGEEGRIRKRRRTHVHGRKLAKPLTEFIFTYKHKLTKRKGSLEIETKISEHDFELAWQEEKSVALNKIRITLHMPWKEAWEVDFFKHNKATYCILAECEMLHGNTQPKQMPEIIKKNLLYNVPYNDNRFKNRNLANSTIVAQLINALSKDYDNGEVRDPNASLPLQNILPS